MYTSPLFDTICFATGSAMELDDRDSASGDIHATGPLNTSDMLHRERVCARNPDSFASGRRHEHCQRKITSHSTIPHVHALSNKTTSSKTAMTNATMIRPRPLQNSTAIGRTRYKTIQRFKLDARQTLCNSTVMQAPSRRIALHVTSAAGSDDSLSSRCPFQAISQGAAVPAQSINPPARRAGCGQHMRQSQIAQLHRQWVPGRYEHVVGFDVAVDDVTRVNH